MLINEFVQKWNDIPEEPGIIQYLSNNSVLCFGRDFEKRKTMLLTTVIEPTFDVKSSSFTIIKVQVGQKWQTTIYLVNKNEEEVFMLFLWDIYECSIGVKVEAELIRSLHKRLLIWEKLFDNKTSYLSEEAIQGLLGELIVIKEVLLNSNSISDIILGWRGPLGEDQDFIMKDEWLEVKAVRYGKEKVNISSLEQLGRSDKGRLVIVEMEQSSEIDPLSTSLFDVVTEIKQLISDDISIQLEFERRLLSVGYRDDIEYKKHRFTLKRIRDYIISDGFPRITRNSIRSEIINMTYSLSISTLEAWKGHVTYEY